MPTMHFFVDYTEIVTLIKPTSGYLLIQQWEKMVKIQQIQLEILTELTHKKY